MRHFLDWRSLSSAEINGILAEALNRKATRGNEERNLRGKSLAMIFEKNSTRTRVSFETAMNELGGHALILQKDDLQLGRGETVADTARVLSRYVHAIMLRAHSHATIIELAQYATVPVINGLTNLLHPCQLLADVMTVEERLGSIQGKTVAWVGDGNNMANSWISAADKLGFTLKLACPKSLQPDKVVLDDAKKNDAKIILTNKPEEAVEGADVVVTDTWISMGDDDTLTRRQAFNGFQVNDALMAKANKKAVFLHCLPAHRGEEVTDSVLDGSQSAVWDEAENRLHVQKAVLPWCFNEI